MALTTRETITLEQSKANHRTDYGRRHIEAWRSDTMGIPSMIVALGRFADEHRKHFGQPIGDDGFLGQYWAAGAHAVIMLLNGHLGNLDGALTEQTLRAIADRNGIDLDDVTDNL